MSHYMPVRVKTVYCHMPSRWGLQRTTSEQGHSFHETLAHKWSTETPLESGIEVLKLTHFQWKVLSESFPTVYDTPMLSNIEACHIPLESSCALLFSSTEVRKTVFAYFLGASLEYIWVKPKIMRQLKNIAFREFILLWWLIYVIRKNDAEMYQRYGIWQPVWEKVLATGWKNKVSPSKSNFCLWSTFFF